MQGRKCMKMYFVTGLMLAWLPAAFSAIDSVDGVRRVRNTADPLDGEQILQLEEIWRVNIEEEDILIGVISAALSGPDESVWLADQQLGQVLVYGADGQYRRTLSREGDGPGEIKSPRSLMWLSGGGLGITDRKQGQITQVDQDGLPLESIHLQDLDLQPMAAAQMTRTKSNGGILAVCGTQFRFDDGPPVQSRFFSIFDAQGQEIKRLMEAPSGFDFGKRTFDEKKNYFVDRGSFAVDNQGRVFHAPEYGRYLIKVHDATGKPNLLIERDYRHRQRTNQEKDDIRSGVVMNVDGEVVQLSCDLQDHDSAIHSIEAIGDQIWVMNGHDSHDQPEGIARTYDIFDAEGHFRQVVRVACQMDRNQDQLFHLADGRWILLRNIVAVRQAMYAAFNSNDDPQDEEQEAEPLEIICLRSGPK